MKGTRLGRRIGQQILKRGLVTTTELQISALSHDSLTFQEIENSNASQTEADTSVAGFHYSPPLNLAVSDALAARPRINVLLPSLRCKDMSGGPNTALVLAALLAEKGEWVRLIACDASVEGEEAALFPHMDGLLQRPVARDRIELADAYDRTRSTAIGANDLFVATAWWTAQMVKFAVRNTVQKTFIYLIQDFEPILHEGSTFHARALETYGLPHIPVINTKLLLDHFRDSKVGCYMDPAFASKALFFEPALDRNYYYSDPGRPRSSGKKTLLFYARPTTARRNLFEIGLVALRQAVASGAIDKESWEVRAMGEKLQPVALGNGVVLEPLPWLSFDAYTERMRTADLLLSLMLAPHPSYPPLEMAASGKLVVTNSFSVKTADRMRAFSPNIIVAEPNAQSIAAALENAVGRLNCGLTSYDPSGAVALPSSWDESFGEVVPALLREIDALRTAPPPSDVPLVTGYPSTPRTNYESYRRECLSRRRREGEYQQEPGLLSFVTSAYNTDPVFLKELGHSVFYQDGGTQLEWLILDNGSTNQDTREALKELSRHPSVRLERVEHNLGIVGGMRFCLEHARGRYILPLDSDDLIEPDCAHVLTRFIRDNNYPPLLYTDEDKFNGNHHGSPYFKPDWDPVLFLHSCYIAHLCAFDREIAINLGLYTDSGAEGCHDWDSFIRFMNAGYLPCHVPEVLYSWRIHSESTSGNITSKSFIIDSHRNTLQKFLNNTSAQNIELVNSPFFDYNVDWWFRRKRVNPTSITTIVISDKKSDNPALGKESTMLPPLVLNPKSEIGDLATLIMGSDSELIHLCWQDVVPDGDEWCWDAMALLELFPESVMVGGVLHDGSKIIDGPKIFGFGEGFDCPESGRLLSDSGYSATMWKPHSASAVSTAHCVIKTTFLQNCMAELIEESVPLEMLGVWLGALAMEADARVVYSPFMRARVNGAHQQNISQEAKARFLSRFWSRIPDRRFYSPRLDLDTNRAYREVGLEENHKHLLCLQERLMPYPKWLAMRLRRRSDLHPLPTNPAPLSLITTVYEGTNIELLDRLAESVMAQTAKPSQWVIVAHGPIAEENLRYLVEEFAERWQATVIFEPRRLGIMGAMCRGLENADGEYIVPVDADDLLTKDAIQILSSTLARLNNPDLLFSDEDVLVEGMPTTPYFRSAFDPVLNLDSSYIWHLCAIKREKAVAVGLYTDYAATWCHDWDTIMRIVSAGGRVEHVPEVLYHWRQHKGSTTNQSHGDPRSLESVRFILDRHIESCRNSEHFYVADWPINRGARELYIARRADNLPPFVWMGDRAAGDNLECNGDAILVVASNGVRIDSQEVLVEVARLMGLHPDVGAVGGLVENSEGVIVDGCCLSNEFRILESPWLGRPTSYGGPYALALKTQSVATTGRALAFFRIAALKRIFAWPLPTHEISANTVMQWCTRLTQHNWRVAFSPLVKARATSSFKSEKNLYNWPLSREASSGHALARYGSSCSFRP